MKSIYSILIFTTFALLLGSCQSEHTHDHSAESQQNGTTEEELNENQVELTQTQLDVMGVEIGSFQYLNLMEGVKTNGTLQLPPQNQASISAIVQGRITKINVHDGDYVKKGQTLAYLEDPQIIELQEQYLSAYYALNGLESSYLRKKKLVADSISSTKDFEQTQASYFVATAKVNGLEKKLRMIHIDPSQLQSGEFVSRVPVVSPISGYIQQIHINTGKYVMPADHLFEVVDTHSLHLDLMIYEKDIPKVKIDQDVIFSLATYPDSLFKGKVYTLGKAFDNGPKAMVAHAHILDKTVTLLPGMFVEATVVSSENTARTLPKNAIVDDGGLHYVFLLDQIHHDPGEDGYVFNKVEVNVLGTALGYSQIELLQETEDDANVVTNGAFYLAAQMKKGQGGGHSHSH